MNFRSHGNDAAHAGFDVFRVVFLPPGGKGVPPGDGLLSLRLPRIYSFSTVVHAVGWLIAGRDKFIASLVAASAGGGSLV